MPSTIWILKVLMFVALLLNFFVAKSQQNDSIKLKKYDRVVYEDSAIVVSDDTVIACDSSILKIKNRWYARFYYEVLFNEGDDASELSTYENNNPWRGRIAGNIRVKVFEPFGTRMSDTITFESWIYDAANTLHVTTRQRIILNNLLFKKGDVIGFRTLEESERILRSLEFIKDARIIGRPRANAPDTVDLYVFAKDVFSINVNFSANAINELEFSLEEINIFGLGHRFYNNFIISGKKGFGYEGRYRIPNIKGTFVNSDFFLSLTADSMLFGVNNERPFISTEIRNAGGASYFYRERRYYSRYDASTGTTVSDNTIDAWYGRSFPLHPGRSTFRGDPMLVLSGRVTPVWYGKRPAVSADTNLVFQRKITFLGNIGYSRSSFYKDILVTGFGTTEDIPFGHLIEMTAGYQFGEFVNRPYADINIAFGAFAARAGHIYCSVDVGSFFRNKKPEDGALVASTVYISKLMGRKKLFKERLLLRLLYIHGINRLQPTDGIDLIDIDALRGIRSNLLFGNTAFGSGATFTIYSPWHVFGFRVAFFGLTDLTYFGESAKEVFTSRPYWGFSGGVSLNNENFIFGTLNLRISVYPSPPTGETFFGIGLDLNHLFSFTDFNSKKPGVIMYGRPDKLYY